MAEKVVSPGVFTNEIDQSFLPAAIGEIGAAIIGPTVKGPPLIPTVVNSFSDFERTFGTTVKSGSESFTYLTSIAARNYLKHGGSLLVTRIVEGAFTNAVSNIETGSFNPSSSVDPPEILELSGSWTGSCTFDVGFGHTTVSGSGATGSAGSTNTSASYASTFSTVHHSFTLNTHGYGTRMNNWNSSTSASDGNGTDGSAPNSQSLSVRGGAGGINGITNALLSGSADNIRWEVSSVIPNKGTFSLLIRAGNDTVKRKQILESWNNLSLNPTEPNFVTKMIGDSKPVLSGTTDEPYIAMSGSYPNKSDYVYLSNVVELANYLDSNGNVNDSPETFRNGLHQSASLPGLGSGSAHGAFFDGSDGYTGFDSKGNMQGTEGQFYVNWYENISTQTQGYSPLTTAKGLEAYTKALNLLANQDEYDFNLLLMPGILDDKHNATVTKAIDMCENRGDAFIIVDPVVYDSNLKTATGEADGRDSNYAATYWPWVQVAEPDVGKNVWVPPSTVMGGIYGFNDKVAHPWFAPAGLNRGGIDTAFQTERKLTQSDRDKLYESNVNPIATFPGQGVCVWGQKTLQRKASALDRINVRRLLIRVKKFIASSSRFLVFEQNNVATRSRFLNIVNPFMEQIQANSGLNAFRVIMDETNNTPDTIDRNILIGQIFVQPTKTAEFILLDFTVQPTGATFPE